MDRNESRSGRRIARRAGVAGCLLISVVVGACTDGRATSTPPESSAPPRSSDRDESSEAPPSSPPETDDVTPDVATTPAPEPTDPPTVGADRITATLDIAPQELGYAGTQGLTGGLGHPVVVVSTADDGGPGSYREALAAGERIVRFDPSLDGETIHLRSPVEATGSDLTVDGSGVDITVSGHSTRFSGTNVVVAGMSFRYNDDVEEDDAITFRDPTTTQVAGVFFNHFEQAADGLVDVIWNRGNDVYVTMCGNSFSHHDKAVLIHSGDDDLEGGTYHVTMCDNAWDDVYQRAPLSRESMVHQYNSLFERYGKADGQGGGSKAGGDGATGSQHLLENNIAVPRRIDERTFDGTLVTSPRTEWAGPQLGNDSSVRIEGTLLVTAAGVTADETVNEPDRVFTPPYDYELVTATVELADVLRSVAGTCVPVEAVERVSPCAPLELLRPGDELGIVIDGDEPVESVFVEGPDVRLAATDQGGGRWTVSADDLTGPFAVRGIVELADGSVAETDVAIVAVVP